MRERIKELWPFALGVLLILLASYAVAAFMAETMDSRYRELGADQTILLLAGGIWLAWRFRK
jgi:hypothetical protein